VELSKGQVAPWHREVTSHAFRSGVTNAAVALKNYDESKKACAKGISRISKVQEPSFEAVLHFDRIHKVLELDFEDSRHVRLILPAFR